MERGDAGGQALEGARVERKRNLSHIYGGGDVWDGEDIRAINGPYPGQHTVPHKWPKNGTIGPRRHRHQLDRIVRDCCLMSELPAIRF